MGRVGSHLLSADENSSSLLDFALIRLGYFGSYIVVLEGSSEDVMG